MSSTPSPFPPRREKDIAMTEKPRVAIIGLGACGLPALKNFRETGFDAVGFDGNPYVGGLWIYNPDPNKTSVLKTTVTNLSKLCGCYTDFPAPDANPDFLTAAQHGQYLQDYANHFDLMSHTRLSTRVDHVTRKDGRWELTISDLKSLTSEKVLFDKVVVSNGPAVQVPKMPVIKGLDTFTGRAFHSNGYKGPEPHHGERVVVVGLGNTGPDTAVDLIGTAKNIWLSHRKGNAIFSRWNPQGKPGDYFLSLRRAKIGGFVMKHLSAIAGNLAILGMRRLQKQAFDIKPEWSINGIQPPIRKVPTMSEGLVPALHAGTLSLKPALTEISGNTLTFSDNTTLTDIDTIIFCTGFTSDYSLLDPSVDPTRNTRKDWAGLPGANGRPLPRLYQSFFSLDHPDSLAFLGESPLTPQACLNYDISSQAVAQIWAGRSSLPSLEEMNRHVDAQHEAVCRIAATGELAKTNMRNNWDWFVWCDEAAGLGMVKRMGYGLEGWKFWWKDRELCKLLMDGIMSPHLFRLFDEGKRKPWDRARDEVFRVNKIARS